MQENEDRKRRAPGFFFPFLGVDLFVGGVEVFFGITLTTCGDELGMNRNKTMGNHVTSHQDPNRYFFGNGNFFHEFCEYFSVIYPP